ncbi:zinc ribbon domain-containing protein [Oribacterium sp. FC2011]|uniref:zinc ribbon domain-containing protein n=1 Tax=Oribacterium sp. FC2011 TaxID=1408311 RepID=UPI0004E125FD|nr:zinc ribbon domain-containing protein [Oribacterium sp. FC2011]
MFCEKCGAKLDDSEKICHVCGAPTDEDEDDLITSDNMSQPQDSIGSVPGSSSGSFLYSGQYNSNPAQGNPLQTGSWQSFNPQQQFFSLDTL